MTRPTTSATKHRGPVSRIARGWRLLPRPHRRTKATPPPTGPVFRKVWRKWRRASGRCSTSMTRWTRRVVHGSTRRRRSAVWPICVPRYLGLELRNPLVASSSPLTGSLDWLRRLEAAGAEAVVLPRCSKRTWPRRRDRSTPCSPPGRPAPKPAPATPTRPATGPGRAPTCRWSPGQLTLSIPVIASLNGVSPGRLGPLRQPAGGGRGRRPGAQHLLRVLPARYLSARSNGTTWTWSARSAGRSGSHWRSSSAYFSSLANLAGQLAEAGADGLVLFNRFYQPDLDIETIEGGAADPRAFQLDRAAPAAALDRHPAPAPPGVAGRLHPGSTRHRRGQGAAGQGGRGHDDLGPAAPRPRPPARSRPACATGWTATTTRRWTSSGDGRASGRSPTGRLRAGQLPQDPRLPPDAQPLTDPGQPQAEQAPGSWVAVL